MSRATVSGPVTTASDSLTANALTFITTDDTGTNSIDV